MVASKRRDAAAAFAGSVCVSRASYTRCGSNHTEVVAKVEEHYQGDSVQLFVRC